MEEGRGGREPASLPYLQTPKKIAPLKLGSSSFALKSSEALAKTLLSRGSITGCLYLRVETHT